MATTMKEAVEEATKTMERSNAIMAAFKQGKPLAEDPEPKKDDESTEGEKGETEEEKKDEPSLDEKFAKLEERVKTLEDEKKKTDEENASLKSALEMATAQMGKMNAMLEDPANVQFAKGVPAKPITEGGVPAPKAKSAYEQWAELPAGSAASRDFYEKHESEILAAVNG